ncbi:hypothetical protein ABPG77_005794 [Micractinium sp. CCAP 211/92]
MPWLLNVRLALGLCTLLSSQTGLQAAGAAALPPLPSWARGPGYRGSGQWKDFAIKQNKQNQAVVDKVDAEGKTFDIILYGESITQLIYRQSKAEWAALFPPSQGWVGAPLGVSGNDIEVGRGGSHLAHHITWRIIAGSERPKRAPRCIALLIGTNDVNAGVPVDKIKLYMDYLLRYLKAAFPTTKIILWKMLPREGLNMAPANAAYLALARKHNATWITCGQYLDARNPAVLYDGTHPTPATQTQLLRCLAPTVMRLPSGVTNHWQLIAVLSVIPALGLAPAAVSASTAELPPLPSWARGPDFRGRGQWEEYSAHANHWNQLKVDAANLQGQRYDFLLYGDSITQLISQQSQEEWAALFPPAQGWLAAPLGVAGNDVEDLTWRVIGGSELPQLAPRCIALLIGTNDVNSHTELADQIAYLEYLLDFLQAAFPTTKFVLWRLLPREGLDMEPVNLAYQALAVQRGLTWITCGSDLDASNPAVLYDGTHPTPATQTQLLRCLAPTVYKLVGRSVRRQAAPRGADRSAAPAPAPMAAAEGPTSAIS